MENAAWVHSVNLTRKVPEAKQVVVKNEIVSGGGAC